MLSMHDNTEYVLESLRAGVHGYLLKDSAAAELRGGHPGGLPGGVVLQPAGRAAARRGGAGRAGRASVRARSASLTGRERQVLVGVAGGRTNKEIAQELGISHRTVESHRESLMRKLDVYTVAGLTKIALEEGLIP